MSDEARLERIEKKLDEVGQAIVALARMEERMITLFKRMDKLDQEQTQNGQPVDPNNTEEGVSYGGIELIDPLTVSSPSNVLL